MKVLHIVELLSTYKDLCKNSKESKESANISCIMVYLWLVQLFFRKELYILWMCLQ